MIYTTLDNFYLSKEELSNSPSRNDGVSEELEAQLRNYGCELIQEGGILLKLPQAVMATGQVLFHRFYCKRSMVKFRVKRVAAACTWLAAKLEETPRRIRDVLATFNRIDRRRTGASLEPLDIYANSYETMKAEIIRIERYMLRAFGFVMHVEHPHKFVLNYLQLLDQKDNKPLLQEAWNLTNDSLRTTLCVRLKGEVVACGMIFMAARRLKVPLPENPPWWDLFSVSKRDLCEVCSEVHALYSQPKAQYHSLPQAAPAAVQPQPTLPPSSPLSTSTAPRSGSASGMRNGEDVLLGSAQKAEAQPAASAPQAEVSFSYANNHADGNGSAHRATNGVESSTQPNLDQETVRSQDGDERYRSKDRARERDAGRLSEPTSERQHKERFRDRARDRYPPKDEPRAASREKERDRDRDRERDRDRSRPGEREARERVERPADREYRDRAAERDSRDRVVVVEREPRDRDRDREYERDRKKRRAVPVEEPYRRDRERERGR